MQTTRNREDEPPDLTRCAWPQGLPVHSVRLEKPTGRDLSCGLVGFLAAANLHRHHQRDDHAGPGSGAMLAYVIFAVLHIRFWGLDGALQIGAWTIVVTVLCT